MKSFLRLSVCLSIVLAIGAGPVKTNAQGTGNHITMSLKNCALIKPDTIQFDLFIMSDGVASSSLRLNSCSYGVNFNTGILAASASYSTSFVNGSSDLIPPLGTFNFLNSSFPGHIRISENLWTGGNVWGQGIINVSSDTVTLVNGDNFICNGCGSRIQNNLWDTCYNCNPTFTLIVINGITDTISTVLDSTHLLLKHPISALSGVSYSVSSPDFVNPMAIRHEYRAGTFQIGSSANFVVGQSTNFSLQNVTQGGHTDCVAVVYIDVDASTTSIDLPGTGDGQRADTVMCNLLITSIKDVAANTQLDIFPNPVQDRFTVSGLSMGGATTIEVFNILGTKIYSETLTNAGKQETVNCKLVAGMYFVQVNNGGKQYVRKIVVQ